MVSGRSKSLSLKPPTVPQTPKKQQLKGTSHFHFLFHLFSFFLFLYGFLWHAKVAVKYSLAVGFGHYAKYLSFWGFLGQLAALTCSLLCHLFPDVTPLQALADDLSSAVFGYANVVSVAYLLLRLTSWTNEDAPLAPRPLWLSLLGHTCPSAFAWLDVLLARRTFSPRSFQLCMLMAVAYVVWLHLLKASLKVYPYPFLNSLPQPEGFIAVALAALGGMFLFFKVGVRLTGGIETKPSPQSRSILNKIGRQK